MCSLVIQSCFSCAYAYVVRVTNENRARQISGFVFLMFLRKLVTVFTCAHACGYGCVYVLVQTSLQGRSRENFPVDRLF